MNKQEAKELVKIAKPLIGKELIYSNSRYTFIECGIIVCISENGNETCRINGKLQSITNENEKIDLNLKRIIELIEN